MRGPGIVKVNTKILDDPVAALQIAVEIEEMMSQTDDSWNPHAKLEFLKVAIWSVFFLKVSKIRKYINEEIKETEEELNQIKNLKKKFWQNQALIKKRKKEDLKVWNQLY
jgi:hypothetical protein